MRMILELPAVASCTVERCAFNAQRKCHAKAVTIGDTGHPYCDTFHPSAHHGGNIKTMAGVGACKSEDCVNNENLECKAPEIHVGVKGDKSVCLDYRSQDAVNS